MPLLRTAKAGGSKRRREVRYLASATAVSIAGLSSSVYARRWREDQIRELQLASDCGVFVVATQNQVEEASGAQSGATAAAAAAAAVRCESSSSSKGATRMTGKCRRRDLHTLATTVSRAGLMGTSVPGVKSVKQELESIRQWHQKRGFNGGLVLRDLTQPLYNPDDDDDDVEGGDDVEPVPHVSLNQRECYYLYYEILPNGETRQQIFCRGTTLLADVGTCLKSVFRPDDELGCDVHLGFREHADRVLRDVEPLLAPASNRRATVEVCGHSLGGAVAILVALKLRMRGYNVVRVTAVGAPRFCDEEAAAVLAPWLPTDTLRIEDDSDPVPFLPPHGAGLGDKLWFVSGKAGHESARFVPFDKSISGQKWIDSVLINLRIPEVLSQMSYTHRVPSYVSRLNQLAAEVKDSPKRASNSEQNQSASSDDLSLAQSSKA